MSDQGDQDAKKDSDAFPDHGHASLLGKLANNGGRGVSVGLNIRQRVVLLAAIFVGCQVRLPVTLLIGSIALSHLAVLGMGRRAVKFPSMAAIVGARQTLSAMMDNSRFNR